MKTLITVAVAVLACALLIPRALIVHGQAGPQQVGRQAPGAVTAPGIITKGDFRFAYDERGVSGLANPNDPFGATITTPPPAARGGRGGAQQQQPAGARGLQTPGAATLGLTISYRADASTDWTSYARSNRVSASPDAGIVTYTTADAQSPLKVTETYRTDGRVLDWTIDLESTGSKRVTVGDVGISLPVQGPTGGTPADIFERGFLQHKFISGAGSFFFYVRASGAPPFLLVTVKPGTKLEYAGAGGPSTGSGQGGRGGSYAF